MILDFDFVPWEHSAPYKSLSGRLRGLSDLTTYNVVCIAKGQTKLLGLVYCLCFEMSHEKIPLLFGYISDYICYPIILRV